MTTQLESTTQALTDWIPAKQFIAGQWRDGRSDKVLTDTNPFDGSQLLTMQQASREDLDEAYAAAEEAQKATGITTVFVTHDQEEAMSISDCIVVMKAGVIHQIGKPQQVYDDPVNLFVAKFLGTPPINVFDGEVRGGTLYLGEDAVMQLRGAADGKVTVGIRPEGFVPDPEGTLKCGLLNVEVMGRDVSVVGTHPAFQGAAIRAIIASDAPVSREAAEVRFRLKPHKVLLFDPQTERRIPFQAV